MRNVYIWAAALLLGFVTLSACANDESAVGYGTDDSVTVNDHTKVNVAGGDDTQIYDVVLNDGTRCVITDGPKSGGVSCDWGTP